MWRPRTNKGTLILSAGFHANFKQSFSGKQLLAQTFLVPLLAGEHETTVIIASVLLLITNRFAKTLFVQHFARFIVGSACQVIWSETRAQKI